MLQRYLDDLESLAVHCDVRAVRTMPRQSAVWQQRAVAVRALTAQAREMEGLRAALCRIGICRSDEAGDDGSEWCVTLEPRGEEPVGSLDEALARVLSAAQRDAALFVDAAERERDLLAETARRLTGERDALRAALERAYRFAWHYGSHRAPCPLAADIDAPHGTACLCGYDEAADALMDAEEVHGFSFWKNARAAAGGEAP